MTSKVFGVVFLCFGVTSAVVPDPARFASSPQDHVTPRNVSAQCEADTAHWMTELRRGVPWALKMIDAATKLPSGVLEGTYNHLGNFDQCLAVSVDDGIASFTGQYCRAYMDLLVNEEVITTGYMWYTFCIPSSCMPEEISELMQNYIGPSLGVAMAVPGINPNDCHKTESGAPLPTGALICVIAVGLLAGVVVVTAFMEWRLADKTPPLVRACSVTSTCRSLFNTRKHPADISCLHGIRVGSMLWIILGHRYGYERWAPITNPKLFETYFQNPLTMTIANAMPSVDTFFFLSGLLMYMSFLREVNRRPKFDVMKFYIYRYLRLAIPIGVIIALYITTMPLIGDGPLWNNYFFWEARNCKANWWTNLIFVNNYIFEQGYGMCLGQTWYTAVDMQLSWLSPLVLLPLYHSPRAGLQLMTLLILISCFIPFTVTYIFRFTMAGLQVWVDIPMEGVPEGDQGKQIYLATQARATPYLCGILFGYYLFQTKGKKINISNNLVYIGWACCTAVALTVIYSLSIPHQPDYVYDLVGSAFYAGFHRLGWSAVLIWIVFACVNKCGGVADKILSSSLLLPLSRLTYSAFLVHFIDLIYESGSTRTIVRYSDYDAVHDFFGDLLPIYVLSFLLYVLVEGPLLSLLRIAFSKGIQPPKKTAENKLENLKHNVPHENKLKDVNLK